MRDLHLAQYAARASFPPSTLSKQDRERKRTKPFRVENASALLLLFNQMHIWGDRALSAGREEAQMLLNIQTDYLFFPFPAFLLCSFIHIRRTRRPPPPAPHCWKRCLSTETAAAGSGSSVCIRNIKSFCRSLLLNEIFTSSHPARREGYLVDEDIWSKGLSSINYHD